MPFLSFHHFEQFSLLTICCNLHNTFGWSGFGTVTVGIDPNTFEVLNGHPNKIPTDKILGGVVQNCREYTSVCVCVCICVCVFPSLALGDHLQACHRTHHLSSDPARNSLSLLFWAFSNLSRYFSRDIAWVTLGLSRLKYDLGQKRSALH